MSNFTKTASKREAISCEPCRQRKIRCGRGKPPCGTCIRRGLPTHCAYKVQRPQVATPSAYSAGNNQPLSNDHDFLQRFQSLENLLYQHIGALPPTSNSRASNPRSSSLSSSHGSVPTNTSSGSLDRGYRGRLITNQYGHVRYEPPSSVHWKLFLEDNAVDAQGDDFGTAETHESLFDCFPFECGNTVPVDELLRDLPPLSYCDKLKTCFFDVFSPLFHILHDSTFEDEYKTFRENPRARPLSWLSLLFVILGIAVTALPIDESLLRELGQRNSYQENIQCLSSRYRKAAMKCLAADGVLYRHNIQSLQALVLLIYSINHSHGHSWPLLGMTCNIALALGCHIDPAHFNLDRLHSEERRRAWAALMMLYTIQNTAMGNLDACSIVNQVQLPADVDDIDLLHDNDGIQRQGPTQMSYLLFKFKLYGISADISRQNLASSPPTRGTINDLELRILTEQQNWNTKYLSDTQQNPLENHHVVHMNILYSYSHQLLLLLHRPSFLSRLNCYSYEAQCESQARCVDSAKAILAIHKTLAETREFTRYKWYNNGLGSFHAFHAAIVLATVLLSPTSGDHDLMPLFSETMARFENLSSQSSICLRATPILKALWKTICRGSNASIQVGSSSFEERQMTIGNLTIGSSNSNEDTWSAGPQMDVIMSQLRPEQWQAPNTMSWNDWSSLFEDSLAA